MVDLVYDFNPIVSTSIRRFVGNTCFQSKYLFNSVTPSKSLLFAANQGGTTVTAYQVDPDNLATASTAAIKTFTTGAAPFSLDVWRHPTDSTKSLLFASPSNATTCPVFQFDAENIGTGTVSTATLSLSTGTGSRSILFFPHPSDTTRSLIFVANITTNQVMVFQVNSDNIGSGTISPIATYTTQNCASVYFWWNNTTPSQSILFCANANNNRIDSYLINPSSLSSGTTPNRTFSSILNASWVDFWENPVTPSQSILFGSSPTSPGTVRAFVINPYSLGSGNTATATRTFTVANVTRSCQFWYNPIFPQNSALFTGDETSLRYSAHYIDATNFGTANKLTPDKIYTAAGSVRGVNLWFYAANPVRSILFGSTQGNGSVEAYLPFNSDGIKNTVVVGNVSVESTSFSFDGSTLTINSTISFFQFASYLGARSDEFACFLGIPSYVQTDDSKITLNENLSLPGTTILGEYVLTMGASTTITLSPRTYTEPIVVPSTGTILVSGNTELAGSFVVSAGTTINRAPGVTDPVTVTVTDNPGLIAGDGVTIAAPQVLRVRAVTGVPIGAKVFLARRSQPNIALLDEFTLAAGNNSGSNILVVSGSIPNDKPASGFIRVFDNSGNEDRYAYSSWSGSTFTLTGVLTKTYAAGNGCYVPYLDTTAISAIVSVSLLYAADRDVVLKVMLGSGVGAIREVIQNYTLTDQDSSVPVAGIADSINNR